MTNTKKIVVGILAGLVVLSLGGMLLKGNDGVGGVYSQVTIDFSEGVSVDGTTVIDGSGNVDAPITSTTGSFTTSLNYKESVETITADDTLTSTESGKVVYIGTAGVDLTLPAAASSAGITYRVMVSANFATTNMTITGGASDASDDLIYGALEVAGAVVACSARDTISFVNSAELPGDFVELHSNGVNWFLTGQGTTAGSITCTDVD